MSEANDLDREVLAQMREDFVTEAREIIDRLGPLLTELEQKPGPEIVNTIFRAVHTLKGSAGFVGLESIRALAHKLEDLFGAVRAGQLPVTPERIDAAFAAIYTLAAMREDAQRGGSGEADIAPMMARLEVALRNEPTLAPGPATETAYPGSAASTEPAESTLRVSVENLDRLVLLVGELITARNALLATAERLPDPLLGENASAIARLIQQLQTTAVAMRLVPIERLFTPFIGVLRNLARQRGKHVRLLIEGGDTPLDRAVSEQMHDPLVHLLRNALEHGIELPAERLQAGKPVEGLVRLSAERRGEDVIIRIADDGRGIDPERVRDAAVLRGICSPDEAAALSAEQAARLIFRPGFTTAAQVTEGSGRGVGLDVVVQNVKRLRGSVDVQSTPGQGTAFVLQLPLTLAILQVLLVRTAGYTYALPLQAVRETLLLAPDAVQTLQQREMVLLRQAALPVHRLSDWLHLSDPAATGDVGARPAIVVSLAGGETVLIVDELVGKQQVVIRPLSPHLGMVRGVEGTAILPDGSVTLILDLDGLAA